MRLTILAVLFFVCSVANATNYYFSSTGSDAASGTSPATAWQTIAKFNSYFSSLSPGDSVLFNRGDVFYGAMVISRSGTSAAPIIIGAYGSGAKPVITGLTTVTGWTNSGSNIWISNNAVSTLTRVNMVVINSTNTAMGRWPNSTYRTITSHSGNSSITDASLPSNPNWTGAEVIIRRDRWTIDRSTITSHSGNTINYSATGYNAIDGFGYFVQNSVSTLDAQNEWYYDPSTKKIQIYSTSAPTNVQVSGLTDLVTMSARSYIRFTDIALQGANNNTFQISSGNNITIQNCDIAFSGNNAINATSQYLTVQDCNINQSNNDAIYTGSTNNITVSHCIISNSGFIAGAGGNQADCYIGILAIGSNVLIEYNQLTNSGYNGIEFNGSNTTIKNNFLNTFCALKDDGAGIYTWNDGSNPPAYTNRFIQDNIIINGTGAIAGTDSNEPLAEGIYLDDNAANVTITRNSIYNCGDGGIFLHNAHEVNVTFNTVYNCQKQLYLTQDNIPSNPSPLANLSINNNIYFSRTSTQWVSNVANRTGSGINFGTYDYNYYTRPINESACFTVCQGGNCSSFPWPTLNLPGWKSLSGQDANSNKAPVGVTTINDLRYEYNETDVDKVIALGGNYIDVKNILYPGTITLAPYTSAVLIKTSSGNIPPTAFAGPDQSITLPVNTVTLSGDGIDPDGLIVAYLWTKVSGPAATITNPNAASTTVTGMVQGAYFFELKVTDNGNAVGRDTMQVTVNAATSIPPPIVGTITQPSCAVATGSVVLSGLPASGTWTLTRTPGGTTTTGTGTTTTINGLTTGTYTYTVTIASVTSAPSANIVINAQPASPATPAVGTITQPSCAVATGSVDLSNLPATGTWTLTRTPGGTTTTGTGTSTTINGLAPGTYTYTVTNASGCISAASANVVINAQPASPATPAVGTITQPSCAVATGSVDLSNLPATGTWTLTRTPGSTTTTGTGTSTTINGLAPGTYTYTVTNASGCISAASANVVINAQPASPATPAVGTITQPSCAVATGSVDLSNLPATGTWTLTRTPGGTTTTGTGTSTTINGLAPGTYTYTVTNASGCISAASANVVINAQPASPASPAVGTITQPSCAVATGSVDLSNLPATGTWTLTRTPGGTTTTGTGTTTTINGLAPGTYTYTVTNASGCISAASANVVINAQPASPATPAVGTITQPSCAVATGSVDLSNLPATGTWTLTRTPGSTTTTGTGTSTTINGLAPGTYTYTVTNASGCISAASANVVINAQPASPATPAVGTITQPSCAVATGSVDLSNLPATGTWTLTRTPGGTTTTGTGTSTTINGLAPGTYTYTVTNASGCISAASANVVINAQPASPASPAVGTITQPSCAVATGSVDLSNLPATGTWTLTRTPGGTTTTGTGTTTTINGLAPGTYTYTVTNASGCISAASANVVINAQPASPATPAVGTITQPTTIVATGSVVLSGLPATGTWTLTRTPGGTTTTGTGTSTTINGLAPGTYTYTVTNGSGCISAASANIVIINAIPNDPPVAFAGQDQTITLPVNFTTLNGSGSDADGSIVGYEWKQLSGPSGNVLFSLNTAITYLNNLVEGTYRIELTVTDNMGAKGRDTVNVVVAVLPAPVAQINNGISIYPNPVINITNLVINKTSDNPTVTEFITDAQGEILLVKELSSPQNNFIEKIDMSSMAKGIYFVTVLFKNNEKKTLKVIKV